MGLRRRTTILGAVTAVLAVVSSAEAAGRKGTVLSFNTARHQLRVVDASGKATTFRLVGKVRGHLSVGARVSFSQKGTRASGVRVAGRTQAFHVKGKVARAAGGAFAVRLADNRPLTVGNVSVTLVGFAADQRVDVTVTDSAAGDVNVVIRLDDRAGGTPCTAPCPFQAEGHVTAVDLTAGTESFTIDSGEHGTGYTFKADPALISANALTVGDEVRVAATDNGDGTYTATAVKVEHDSSHDGDGARPHDVFGIVSTITDTTFTLSHPGAGGGESLVVAAAPDLLTTLHLDELVHAVVVRGADGTVTATSATEVVLPPATIDGVVRVVAIGADSFLVGDTRPEHESTLTLHATAEQMTGWAIAPGDHIHLTAHRDAPEHWVADTVTKLAPPPPPPPPPGFDAHGTVGTIHDDGSFDVVREDGPDHHLVTWLVLDPSHLLGAITTGTLVNLHVHVDGPDHHIVLDAISPVA